jgi:hypothetical protein
MKIAFLILAEKPYLAKTIVSLEENSVKPDNYIILVNSNTSDANQSISKSLSGNCCGQTTVSREDQGYTISTKNNFIVVEKNTASNVDIMNYAKSILPEDTEIVFTATSGSIYSKNYIERVIEKFNDSSIGLVYSDYISDGHPVHLQYIQPMLSSQINIKEFAVRKTLLLENLFKINSFDFVMDLFSVSIICHIPEELYVI